MNSCFLDSKGKVVKDLSEAVNTDTNIRRSWLKTTSVANKDTWITTLSTVVREILPPWT